MAGRKTVILASGAEDGIRWTLQKNVGLFTKDYEGDFFTASCEATRKDKIRAKDRQWFKRTLGRPYMKGKEVHHQWTLGERCYVLSPKAHRIRDKTEAENRNRIK